MIAACGKHGGHASAAEPPPPPDPAAQPTLPLERVDLSTLCVTHGPSGTVREEVTTPTFRAIARGHAGDAASLRVRVRGSTTESRALASGQERRQLGLKLRAADGCNLVYVMWRLDPKPKLEVSVKRNPGAHTAKECGNRGYTKVKPAGALPPPSLDDQLPHELRAEIRGDALTAWIDGKVAWQGTLPQAARELAGPPGVRSDDLAFQIVDLEVDARQGPDVEAKCAGAGSADSEQPPEEDRTD